MKNDIQELNEKLSGDLKALQAELRDHNEKIEQLQQERLRTVRNLEQTEGAMKACKLLMDKEDERERATRENIPNDKGRDTGTGDGS